MLSIKKGLRKDKQKRRKFRVSLQQLLSSLGVVVAEDVEIAVEG